MATDIITETSRLLPAGPAPDPILDACRRYNAVAAQPSATADEWFAAARALQAVEPLLTGERHYFVASRARDAMLQGRAILARYYAHDRDTSLN